MEMLASARKRLAELSNIAVGAMHASNDAMLENCRLKINELGSLLLEMRTDLSKYANSVLAMAKLSEQVGSDIAILYQASESRQRSIRRFVESGRMLQRDADKIFREQFGKDVLGLLDVWIRQIDFLKGRIESACNFLSRLERKESRGDPDAGAMRTEFEKAKKNLSVAVHRRVETRFSVFDAILVALMECQIAFSASNVAAVHDLSSNVENYRKRYPRGTIPEALQSRRESVNGVASNGAASTATASPPLSKMAATTSQQELERKGHVHHHHRHHPRQNDPLSDSEESEDSDDSFESESASDGDEATLHASSPPQPQQPEPVDLLGGFEAHSHTNDADAPLVFMGNSAPPTMDDLFGSPSINSSDAKQQGPNSNSSSVDVFDPFVENSQKSSSSKTSKQSMKDHGFEMFDPMAPTRTSGNDGSSNGRSSSGKEAKAKAKAGSSQVRPPQQKQKQQQQEENVSLRDRIARSQNEGVQFMRDQISAQAQLQDDKRAAADGVAAALDQWEFKDGVRRPIRTLLTSMHSVMWKEANFKPIRLGEVVSGSDVKKKYRRALLQVHPDKVRSTDPEICVIAERIFDALTLQFNEFNV